MTPSTNRETIDAVRGAQNRKRDRAARRSDRAIVEQVRTAQGVRRARFNKLSGGGRQSECPKGQEVVYVFLLADRSVFKIGRTCDLSSRLASHRREAGRDIRVLALIACASREESVYLKRDLHGRCAKWRRCGRVKWFSVTAGSRAVLERILLESTHPAWVRYANKRLSSC